MKKTWALLRHLLDPTSSKTITSTRLHSLINNYPGTSAELLDKLRSMYIPTSSSQNPSLPHYSGPPNVSLDQDITVAEVRHAISQLRRQTAPGSDKVTNKILRQLTDHTIDSLTALFNHHWSRGTLPSTWRHADISLIPKAHKAITLEHLRPISLTSCLGKLLEHIINTRITTYLEIHHLLPHTLTGFRQGLSVQDTHLRLYHDIIANPSKADTSAILALDLHKAFDNVSHVAILNSINSLGLGARTYSYISSFLRDRTATLRFGPLQTSNFPFPAIGTPQGSVISPLLFNLAMIPMATALSSITNLHTSIYADDITLWVKSGSDALIEHTLQQGADIVQATASQLGLQCSSHKSELLLLHPPCKQPPTEPPITVYVDNHIVPHVSSLRVLGLTIQANRGNATTLTKLRSHVLQTLNLLRRITTRRHGISEPERLQLLHSFVLSRFTFYLPYCKLNASDKTKLDCLLRRIYRVALLIPPSAPTSRLLALGIHNTVDEIIEAHRTAQIARLSRTHPGRALLAAAHLTSPFPSPMASLIPTTLRQLLHVRPLPRNMHPHHHADRRLARARHLQRTFPPSQHHLYVDAASYHDKPAFATTVISSLDSPPLDALTIHTTSATAAEEAAISLALVQSPTPRVVLSDSQSAIRNFSAGLISPLALKILSRRTPSHPVALLWTPAHTGTEANEAAHRTARALVTRAGPSFGSTHGTPSFRDALVSYRDITQHFRLLRRIYPPPHPSLTHEAARHWRLLQTHTTPCRTLLHRINPNLYPSPLCPQCLQPDTRYHSLCECPHDPFPPFPSPLHWEQALESSDPEVQLALTNRAAQVAENIASSATPLP